MKRSITLPLQAAYWSLFLVLLAFFFLALPASNKPGILEALFHSQLTYTILLPAVLGFYFFHGPLFTRYAQAPLRLFLVALPVMAGTALFSFGTLRLFGPQYVLRMPGSLLPGLFFMALVAGINGAIGLVLRGFSEWRQALRLKEELKRQNLRMELELVKTKLQPHFLFNTLNNIDVLIGQDPQRASDYLNRLSGLLRFLLYETSAPAIPLQRELDFITTYLDLQRIRLHEPDLIRFEMAGAAAERAIGPMLFLPIIENAFTYGDPKKPITIRFVFTERGIQFQCSNFTGVQESIHEKGLGLPLIRRRLDLLYPGRHELVVERREELFVVTLNLKDDPLPGS